MTSRRRPSCRAVGCVSTGLQRFAQRRSRRRGPRADRHPLAPPPLCLKLSWFGQAGRPGPRLYAAHGEAPGGVDGRPRGRHGAAQLGAPAAVGRVGRGGGVGGREHGLKGFGRSGGRSGAGERARRGAEWQAPEWRGRWLTLALCRGRETCRMCVHGVCERIGVAAHRAGSMWHLSPPTVCCAAAKMAVGSPVGDIPATCAQLPHLAHSYT
jgi:hypothetical protein